MSYHVANNIAGILIVAVSQFSVNSPILGCGINFWMPSMISLSISEVTTSLLVILGAHVEHSYARLCRVSDLEIPCDVTEVE